MSASDTPKASTTAEEMIARGGFIVSRLKLDTRIVIESNVGTLYTLTVKNPSERFVEVYATDPVFKRYPPKLGIYLESWSTKLGGIVIPDWIVKDGRMLIRFRDANFLSEPVATVLLEGNGWKYEVIA